MRRFVLATVVIACLAPTALALAATAPTGTFKAEITSNLYGGSLKGPWTITFKNGAYTVTDRGSTVIHGDFTVSGTRMTFADKSGKDICLGAGTYTFKLAGSTLKFTKIKDTKACAARSAVLAGNFTKTSM
jgi:hypothetical protein